jgi:glutamate--cysteine ligase catalytic subunit
LHNDDIQNYGPGWRVEFRPLEVQLSDFENAAYAIAVVLISRCIIAMGYNFYMPMSYVEENMRRAQLKDAYLTQKFWIRKESLNIPSVSSDQIKPNNIFVIPTKNEIEMIELSLNEIMNGQQNKECSNPFRGIIPVIIEYVQSLGCGVCDENSDRVITALSPYLTLLQKRAAG